MEFHHVSQLTRVADYTAGGGITPRPKISAICNYKIIFSFVKYFRKTFTISWTEKFFFLEVDADHFHIDNIAYFYDIQRMFYELLLLISETCTRPS